MTGALPELFIVFKNENVDTKSVIAGDPAKMA